MNAQEGALIKKLAFARARGRALEGALIGGRKYNTVVIGENSAQTEEKRCIVVGEISIVG